MVRFNSNVPLCYTLAYTSYGLGCVVARAGRIQVYLHAKKPAAVVNRHLIGLMLSDSVFGCLPQANPDRVPAEGAGVLWNINGFGPRHSPASVDDQFPA